MSVSRTCLTLLAAVAVTGCAGEADTMAPPSVPTRLAPGVISTGAPEFALTASPDMTEFYFNRVAEDGTMHIYLARHEGAAWEEGWSAAGPLGFSDGRYNDIDPFLSRDGARLWFSSNRPGPEATGGEAAAEYDVWYADRQGDNWGEPVHAGTGINTDRAEVFVSESADGDIVVTRFGGPDGRTPSLIMTTRERLAEEAREGETAPSALRLTNPAISADGTMLVMAGTVPPAREPALYASRRSGEGWGAFSHLEMEEGAAFAPYLSADGSLLFYTAETAGEDGAANRDIFVAPMPSMPDEG